MNHAARTLGVTAFLAFAMVSSAQSQTSSLNLNQLQLSPHHVTASVADLEEEASWYERVLGFRRSERMGDPNSFLLYQMTMPGYRIDLAWQKGSTNHRIGQGAIEQGWLHVVFKTPNIDAAFKSLQAKGTDVKAYRDNKSVITRIAFHDPEGNELEIVRP
jgi:catechol 2,3-dioxygenase-like lactoylglutathione lyase family enzyme